MSSDFTIELRVYKSAGLDKDRLLGLLTDLCEAMTSDPIYIYPRESKIFQQSILEVTGVKRDLTPKPVIDAHLLAKLEYYIAKLPEAKCVYGGDERGILYCHTHNIYEHQH